MKRNILLLLLILPTIKLVCQSKKFEYPQAHKEDIQDNYFGTVVKDPYRWLENDSSSDTKKWVEEQNVFAEKYLKKYLNKYDVDVQIWHRSYYSFGTLMKKDKYYFELFKNGNVNSANLFIKKKLNEVGDLVVNPSEIDKHANITSFAVSEDGKYLSYNLSYSGSDWNEVRVKALYPFKDLEDIVKWVKFSSVEWKGKGFFYKRYKANEKDKFAANDLNGAIYYHKLGTLQKDDSLIYQENELPSSYASFKMTSDKRFLILYTDTTINSKRFDRISFFDFNDQSQKRFKQLFIYPFSKTVHYGVVDSYQDKFLLYTDAKAPKGKLISMSLQYPHFQEVVVPEYKETLEKVNVAGDKIICKYLNDIYTHVMVFDFSGTVKGIIEVPVGTSVGGFENSTDDEVLYYVSSYLHPPIAYEYNVNTLKNRRVSKTLVTYNLDDFEMFKVFYTSKDGTKIPMIIAKKKKTKRNIQAPIILYGYGGFGISMNPFFDVGFLNHIENGGMLAFPSIRGGGEYGEEWHKQGSLLNKQNSFDDFIAAADYLVKEKYTTNERLAIWGGSNGGLLVAAVMNQRPDICKVAIAEVGVYDMLRYQNFTLGNFWADEYGTSQDSTQFKNLLTYSPIHNVKDTATYPAVLIFTGDHDDRVVPYHSYKYAATLQAKSNGENPIMLITSKNSGHNTSSDGNKNQSYIYAFIYKNMKINATELYNRR